MILSQSCADSRRRLRPSCARAAARLAGDALAARFGPVRLARAGSLVAAAGHGLALLAPVPVVGLVRFALLGIGLGPVVPTVISASGGARLGSTEHVLSRVFTIGYTGSVIGPAVIGFTTEHVGLRGALIIPRLPHPHHHARRREARHRGGWPPTVGLTKAQTRYRSKKAGRYVSKAYAARRPDTTLAETRRRWQHVSLRVAAAGVAVAALAIAAAVYKRLAK